MLGANPANPAAPSRIKVGSQMSPDMAKEETNEELRDSFDGEERDLPRQRAKGRERKTVGFTRRRKTGKGGESTEGGCVVMLLGDEANMHALDPAKVHLDRIALHYAVLQWCSISQLRPARALGGGGSGERGGNGNGTSDCRCASRLTALYPHVRIL